MSGDTDDLIRAQQAADAMRQAEARADAAETALRAVGLARWARLEGRA